MASFIKRPGSSSLKGDKASQYLASRRQACLSPQGYSRHAFAFSEPEPSSDYDSPWKEALELYFEQALSLLMPALHALVDWSKPVELLDKEFQALSHQLPSGRRMVDKLARVSGRDGSPMFILVHIEVQGGVASAPLLRRMAERMTFYMFRIRDGFRQGFADGRMALFSMAVLSNSTNGPPMLRQEWVFLECAAVFQCPVIHLGQWWSRWDELKTVARTNPFAVVVMAQLLTHRHKGEKRLTPKTRLIRMLYQYGYSHDAILSIFRLIDWMLILPPEQEQAFIQAMQSMSEERNMPFVTSLERHFLARGKAEGIAEGKTEGMLSILRHMLTRKFGPLPEWADARLVQADPDTLALWSERILFADSLEDVFETQN